jgi:hypothetical protein
VVIPAAGFLDTWCEQLGHVGEHDPEAHLVTGIAVVSAIAAPKLRITFGKSVEFCHVWQLIVGQSALGAKTSTLQSARAAIERARYGKPPEVRGMGDAVRFDYLTRATDAGIVELLGAPTEEQAKEWSDTWPPSWLLAWNEVSTLFTKDAARWEESSRRVLLSVYDGYVGSHTKATKAHATRCSVTMVGNIPPHVLQGSASELMFSSGFAGRWLVMPTPPLTKPMPFSTNGGVRWEPIEHSVDNLCRVVAATKQPIEHVINLWSDGAKATYTEWYERLWAQHNAANDQAAHRAAEIWGRARTTAQKLATLAALARSADFIDDLTQLRVGELDVEWALALVDRSCAYWAPMIEDTADHADPEVEALVRYARTCGATSEDGGVTVREFMTKHRSNGRVKYQAERVRRAISSAAAAGLIDFREQGRSVSYWVVEQ